MSASWTFAGTSYLGTDGAPERIELPGGPPHLGQRPATRVDTWMWYFAGWEPEYTIDGWPDLAVNAPERVPLLADPRVVHGGQRYYHNGDRDVVSWHVRWMREAGVKSVVFEFIPTFTPEGELSTPLWGNRALELGFLGKDELGGPAVDGTLYDDAMEFVVMWTNHDVPGYFSDGATPELADYIVTQFLSQPNYSRVNGRPVLLLWMPDNLIAKLGSEQAAADYVEVLRGSARRHGLGEITILAVNEYGDAAQLKRLGLDGGTGYHLDLTGGHHEQRRTLADGTVVVDCHEDFLTQTVPGHEATWRATAQDCHTHGLDYLVPVCPMQDWTPLNRGWKSVVYDGATPETFAVMLQRAEAVVADLGLSPVLLVEAWNEWGEGSYLEPSLEHGFRWLGALLDGTRASCR